MLSEYSLINLLTSELVSTWEESRGSHLSLLKTLDDFHISRLHELVKQAKNTTLATAVEGVYETYNATVGLINYFKGLKPTSFLPSMSLKHLEEYISTSRPRLNPFVELLVKRCVRFKRVSRDDLARVFDNIRRDIVYSSTQYERLIAGLLYDITLLRLCSIQELEEATFRPLLINYDEYLELCRLARVDIPSALDSTRRLRPIFSIISLMAEDVSKLSDKIEIFDFIATILPAYYANLMLHVYDSSELLKAYFLLLRQSVLLRLVLTSIVFNDEELKTH